jgi:hypothetical protein
MQLIRRSKNYLIKVLTNLLRSLNEKPNNKGDTIYALPYKSNINKIEEKDSYEKSIIVPYKNDDNNTIRIVSSYIKSIKIKKK